MHLVGVKDSESDFGKMPGLFDSNTNKTYFTTFSDFGQQFEGQTALEVIFLNVIVVCGVTGNTLVILSTVLFKHMRATSNLLLCYQSAADFCLALHPLPIMVTRVTSHWVLGDLLCRSYMYTFFITGCLTLLCMCALAIDRFLSICRPQSYNFLKSHPYLSAVLLLIISIVVNYNNLIEWREIIVRRQTGNFTFCGREWNHNTTSTFSDLVRTISFYLLPLCIIFGMHAVVWNHVRQSARRIATVRMSIGSDTTERRNSEATRNNSVQIPPPSITRTAQTKLLQMLLLSFIMFVLMFTPFVVVVFVVMYGTDIGRSHHRAWMFATILAMSNCFVNPLLIYLFNVKYRACFNEIIHFRYKSKKTTVNSLVTGVVFSANGRQ